MRALLLLALLLVFGSGAAAQTPSINMAELAIELQRGGHVIVMRHGATHQDQADLEPLKPDSSRQRQLNDQGRDAARAFGAALKTIGVPVGKIYTSRFNRAYETARLAGLTDIEKSVDITEGGLVVSPLENARRAAALKALVSAMPAPGTTIVVVTHKPNIMDALGKDWFEVREGEASIFRPQPGGAPVLVARVRIEQWPAVAAAAVRR